MYKCCILIAVVPLLRKFLASKESQPAAVYEQALRCFSSWAQFGLLLPESEPIIQLVFQALHDDQHFEVAIDTLISVFSHPDNHRLELAP